jgi:uncharacterized repeat protein (TIGR01451 family)
VLISISAAPGRAYPGQAVTLTVKLTNESSMAADDVFVGVTLPWMYSPFENPTGVFDPATRQVRWWVATVPPGTTLRYTVIVRVDELYGDRTMETFTAEMTYDQGPYTGLTGTAQVTVDTGSLGDGDLQVSTNAPSPPNWLWVRVHLGQPGRVTLRIYNSAGELVRNLEERYPGSEKEVLLRYWDGKNDDGETVAAGVYIIQAMMPHTTRIAKVLVLH